MIRDLSTVTAIESWSWVSNPPPLIPNRELFPLKYIFPFKTARNSWLNCVHPAPRSLHVTQRGNASSFDTFELEVNMLERRDYPSLFRKTKPCSGSDLWGCSLSKSCRRGVLFCSALLTWLWISLHSWPAPTPLDSWLPTASFQELRQAWVSTVSTGGEGLGVCPAVQWGSTRPVDDEWHFCPNAQAWPRSDGPTMNPRMLKHMAPGTRLTSQKPLWRCNPFCVSLPHFYVELGSLIFRGTIFCREELCWFFSIVLLQLKRHCLSSRVLILL